MVFPTYMIIASAKSVGSDLACFDFDPSIQRFGSFYGAIYVTMSNFYLKQKKGKRAWPTRKYSRWTTPFLRSLIRVLVYWVIHDHSFHRKRWSYLAFFYIPPNTAWNSLLFSFKGQSLKPSKPCFSSSLHISTILIGSLIEFIGFKLYRDNNCPMFLCVSFFETF